MKQLSPVWSFLRDVALGVLIWFLITATIGEARMVPSSSMEPTIQIGDRLWTDKLLLRFEPIKRGDIVVLNPPFKTSDPYIKRVIGLPGETVTINGGKVWIDGQPLNEPYEKQPPNYTWGPVTISAGQYLVLGDNRNDSYDGHYWGLLSRNEIIARAVYRIWPLNRIGNIK